MAKTRAASVTEYIASKPKEVRAVLKRVAGRFARPVPKATEGMSYQIPAYKLNGVPVLYFAGWKEHFSLYPVSDSLVRRSSANWPATSAAKAPSVFPFPNGSSGEIDRAHRKVPRRNR